VTYAPLASAAREDLAKALAGAAANVAIHTGELDSLTLSRWREQVAGPLVSIRVEPGVEASESLAHPDDWSRPRGRQMDVCLLGLPSCPDLLARALAAGERAWQRELATIERVVPSYSPRQQSVLVAGLGIVNLITAYWLSRAGYSITAVDAGPDPRNGCDWRRYGCSRGGGDARMYSMTEADDYHDKALDAEPINDLFQNPVSKGGWLVSEPGAPEREWISDFERVPPWLARSYTADILALNRTSGDLWDQWLAVEPELFSGMSLSHDILRLYSCRTQLRESIERQVMVGSLRETYSPSAVRREFPALAEAREAAMVGGIMVRGFTLQVHRLMNRLLDELEQAGADIRFLSPLSQLLRDETRGVTGAVIGGSVIERDHYALSLGIDLSNVTPPPALRNQVHGVLGAWITLPNLEPQLANSLKIARRYHLTEDANVTVAMEGDSEVLYFGSGYGYTGSRGQIEESEMTMMREAILDSVEAYFPQAYETVGKERLAESFRYCVRPWTSSCLGVFASEPASRGVAVWTGGHNTGGFAQAPVVAEAVQAALRGDYHDMHAAYRPGRQAHALGSLSRAAVPAAAEEATAAGLASSVAAPVT
jgi:D-amino-acid dehydrogenase